MPTEIAKCALLPLIEATPTTPALALNGELYLNDTYDGVFYKDSGGTVHAVTGATTPTLVGVVEAQDGTGTVIKSWTPERVKQAIVALGGSGATLPTTGISSDITTGTITTTRMWTPEVLHDAIVALGEGIPNITTALTTENLDTLTDEGVYHALGNTTFTGNNYPIEEGGLLYFNKKTISNWVQEYTSFNTNRRWHRTYRLLHDANAPWSSWVEYNNLDNILLGSDEDLNTITSTGNYHATTAPVVYSLYNYPVSESGYLNVIRNSLTAWVQEYTSVISNRKWFRTHVDSTWSPWELIATHTPTILTNENLDTLYAPGYYYSTTLTTFTNNHYPIPAEHGTLHILSGIKSVQEYTSTESNRKWFRSIIVGSANVAWTELVTV